MYCRSAPTDTADVKTADLEEPQGESKARAPAATVDVLGAQSRKLQHEDALCALVAGTDSASGEDELWMFHINSGSQDGKDSAASDIAATSNGAISGDSSLPPSDALLLVLF